MGSFHLLIAAFVMFSQLPIAKADSGTSASDKMRLRLEQLFIWRVSDRLALTTDQESKFTQAYRKLYEEKGKQAAHLDELLDQMEKLKNEKKPLGKVFTEYQTTLKKYNDLQSREMEQMAKIFDSQKMAEYVLLKREMTQKFKDVLVQNAGRTTATQTPLKDPEVIQEK